METKRALAKRVASFQLQPLKLANSLFKTPLLRLQIGKSTPLNLLQLHGNLLLISRIIEDLVLLVDAGLCLLELLGGLGDLGVDVYAVFDVQEDSSGGGDGEDDTASRTPVRGGEGGESGDEFAAEGRDGLSLGRNGVVGGGIIGLDVYWGNCYIMFLNIGRGNIPFASFFKEYSAIKDLTPFETPRTSS